MKYEFNEPLENYSYLIVKDINIVYSNANVPICDLDLSIMLIYDANEPIDFISNISYLL